MSHPLVPVGCITPAGCATSLAAGAGSSLASAAASSVLGVFSAALDEAAAWLVGHVMDLINSTTSPHLGATWFAAEMSLMEHVSLLLVLPVLMAATIGPVLRQDGRRVMRVWGVGLPVAVFAGLVTSQLAGRALTVTDALCGLFTGSEGARLGQQFSDAMTSSAVAGSPVVVQLVLSLLTITGTFLVWLELTVRGAAVYVATFFAPLALVGYIWPATASMARRALELLAALILSKFVIVATLSLGLAAVGGGGLNQVVAGTAMLLLAGFAPFALMRLAPVVEASAIGHLEGMSRRPLRAAARVGSAAAAAPVHPVAQMVMAARTATAPADPSPVAPHPIPPRQADYRTGPTGASRSPGGGDA